MIPAHVVQIVTPKKVILNGLWFGPKRPKRAFLFLHGLTGSAFSMNKLVNTLTDKETAVLTFNNRGAAHVTDFKKGRKEYIRGGTAFEKFMDSSDDIQGAINFARKQGSTKVYLAGHSTGAQKVMYWASKNGGRVAHGIILLGPLSDYAGIRKSFGTKKLARAVAHARRLVASGKPQALMPRELSEWFLCSAQRFLSLYTPDSPEEIFSYVQPTKIPKTLRSVRQPILALFAGKDEYADMPTAKIADWFAQHLKIGDKIVIVPGVGHSFKGGEKRVVRAIRDFVAKK